MDCFIMMTIIGFVLLGYCAHQLFKVIFKRTGILFVDPVSGQAEVGLPFEPSSVAVTFEDDPDAAIANCAPQAEDSLSFSVTEINNQWVISITWNVSSRRKIRWAASRLPLGTPD